VGEYESSKVQYTALADSHNDWAMVGTGEEVCMTYANIHHADPVWGVTGEDSEGMTRYLICCSRDDDTTVSVAAADGSEGDSTAVTSDGGGGGGTTAATTQPPAASPSESDQAEILEIQEIVEASSYEPVWYDRSSGWEGRTYDEAAAYCANNHAGGLGALCPYEAVCPNGPRDVPIGGIFPYSSSAQWTALADSYNDWVMVGPGDDVCRTYVNVHYESPAWGLTGENSEEMTQALICCRSSMTASAESENDSVAAETSDGGGGGGTTAATTQPPSESDQAEILEIQEYNDAHSFEPVWYDRSSGWEGRTYVEAASFCANNHAGGHGALCPYEAVCPTGPGSIPIGGVFQDYDANDATSVQWTPLADSYNDWVLVGYSDDVCRTYMNVHYESPAWGLTGENSEEITEALVCCRDMTASAESENDSVAAETSDGGGGGGTTASLSQTEIQELYNDAHSFEPVWYDRSSGWEGRTYDEASSFCANNHAGGLGVLCPYEAVCPTGPSNVPIGGVFEDYGANGMDDASLVQWTPLSDSYNDWVMVGPNPDVCRTYMNVHYESPAWGLTGENSDDITQALICCSNATASVESANDSVTSVASDGLGGWTIPAALDQADESVSIEEASSNQIRLEFAPVAYNRNSGWMGQRYLDALIFCASKDSKIPCPYEVVCSNLESELVDVEAGWVPIIDSPNGWARVGHSSGTCMRYNDLESHPRECLRNIPWRFHVLLISSIIRTVFKISRMGIDRDAE